MNLQLRFSVKYYLKGSVPFRVKVQFIIFLIIILKGTDPFKFSHADVIQSELHTFKIEKIASGLSHPWSLAFLPDGDMLVTERSGQLRLIQNNKLLTKPVSGLPDIYQQGQGGLMDVVLHPEFSDNQILYLSYTGKTSDGLGTEVMRARLVDQRLLDVKVIFRALPKSSGGRHFGGRLLFSSDGYLFITLGDRGDRPRAQRLDDHAGALIRIHENGEIPRDNPFIAKRASKQEIYSYGHRNIQGIVQHPHTNEIWIHEHGPQGGDEINLIKAGSNYGWPTITYGVNYVIGTKIGVGTHKKGLEQPLYFWTPSIAPSGMAFYTGNEFPHWKDQLFVGSLKFGLLLRLKIEGQKVVHEERMLANKYGRIRDVRQGPDGALYLLTDEKQGAVLRLSSAKKITGLNHENIN